MPLTAFADAVEFSATSLPAARLDWAQFQFQGSVQKTILHYHARNVFLALGYIPPYKNEQSFTSFEIVLQSGLWEDETLSVFQ